jgi:hypothetical protein
MHVNKFFCSCGGTYTYLSINTHLKTNNHQSHLMDHPDYVIDKEGKKRKEKRLDIIISKSLTIKWPQ